MLRAVSEQLPNSTTRAGTARVIYTWIIVLLPNIAIYSSGLPGMNLGEVVLVMFLAHALITPGRTRTSENTARRLNPLIFYILVISTAALLLDDEAQPTEVIPRIVRIVFYLAVVGVASWRYFDPILAGDIIPLVGGLNSAYLILQSVVYDRTGVALSGRLPSLPLYTSGYATRDLTTFYKELFYRPYGFFLEPAHYSQYALIALALVMFRWKLRASSVLLAALLTLGIVLSTSGQGLLISATLWVVYIGSLSFISRGPKGLVSMGAVTLLLIALLPRVMTSTVVQNTVSRFSAGADSAAVSGRSQGFELVLSQESVIRGLLGVGWGNTPEGIWFSSIAYVAYTLGILGLLLVLALFVRQFLHARESYSRALCLVCLLLAASSEILIDYWSVLVFSLLFFEADHRKQSRGRVARD